MAVLDPDPDTDLGRLSGFHLNDMGFSGIQAKFLLATLRGNWLLICKCDFLGYILFGLSHFGLLLTPVGSFFLRPMLVFSVLVFYLTIHLTKSRVQLIFHVQSAIRFGTPSKLWLHVKGLKIIMHKKLLYIHIIYIHNG